MSRSLRKRTTQQPLGREDIDNHDTIENNAPEEPPTEEESTQGGRKKSKVQAIKNPNQIDA